MMPTHVMSLEAVYQISYSSLWSQHLETHFKFSSSSVFTNKEVTGKFPRRGGPIHLFTFGSRVVPLKLYFPTEAFFDWFFLKAET